MAIDIKLDLVGNPEPPTIILANRNGNKLGQLKANAESIDLVDKFNDASEISFTVNKYIDDEITPLWDKIVDFKLVYCKEWDTWFEIRVELDEETESVKTVFGTQLGYAELSQVMLYNIEINTEKDIERDDYKITILYDVEDSKASLLDRIFEKAPHYSVIHVDSTIANIQRSFSFDDTSIVDACQEIAEEIGCLFIFHSNSDEKGMPQRTVSVYDLYQNCNYCGDRGEFTDECPKCGSTDIKYGYGDDTLIFVTADELATGGIQLVTDTDAVKNCFKLEAGDDLMTATIRNCNPNGTDYIWYFSDSLKEDMSDELANRLNIYDASYKYYYTDYVSKVDYNYISKYNSLVGKYSIYNEDLQPIVLPIKGYSSLMNAYYNVIDLAWYLKSGLMPSIEMSETNAAEQAALLTRSSLSPVAVTDVSIVSLATANSAVLSMAKTIVKPTYKVQVKTSEIVTSGSTKSWKGNFVVTNYSDEEDTAISNTISVELDDNLEAFIKQKINKALDKENTDDLSITGLFKKDYDDFCAELEKYALVPLTSFREACQSCIDILIEQGVASLKSDLYADLYLPYYNKLTAIESEMKIRENEVNSIIGTYDLDGNLISEGIQTMIEELKNEVQKALDFQECIGEDLWLEFCAYRREDKYSNDNYISDGLNNAELFKKALEFYRVAENEIYKSAELQHSISSTLNNLLAIEKFKPLVKSFKTGNWLRVRVDERIFKLRLLEYEIDFGDFENISVEFSDVTKIKSGVTDVESILSQASSMASSYGAVMKQADKGNDARSTIRKWMSEGLNTALVQIQNNVNEDIIIDKNGLLGRSYSDITGTYSPEQIKLTHNIIAYTDDDWKTVRQAIGKHKYKYYDKGVKDFIDGIGFGVGCDFITAGYVSGSQIIGGDIYSDNYVENQTGSYLNLRDGTFSFGGGSLRYNSEEGLIISSPNIPTRDTITEINEEYLKTTSVYAENLQINSANISGTLTIGQLPSTVAETNDIPTKVSQLTNDSGYQTRTGVTTIVGGIITTDYVNALKVTAGSVAAENITGTTIKGKSISGGSLLIGNKSANTYAEITSGGVLNCKGGNFTNACFTVDKTFIRTAKEFKDGDAELVLEFATGRKTPTVKDYEKYDIDGNGVLTSNDASEIQKLLNGVIEEYSIGGKIEINPTDSQALIKTNGVSIGKDCIYATNITTTGAVNFSGNITTNSNVFAGTNNAVRISRGVEVGVNKKNALTLTLLEDTNPRLDIYASDDDEETVMFRSVTTVNEKNSFGYMSLSPEYLIVGNWEAVTKIDKPTTADFERHYAKVKAEGFENASLESIKTNIVETDSVLDLFKPENSKIYSYNLKKTVKTKAEAEVETVDNGDDGGVSLDGNGVVIEEEVEEKTSYGFVIGDDYTVPEQVLNKGRDAISLYSMASLNWKATQELYELYKELESKLNK